MVMQQRVKYVDIYSPILIASQRSGGKVMFSVIFAFSHSVCPMLPMSLLPTRMFEDTTQPWPLLHSTYI